MRSADEAGFVQLFRCNAVNTAYLALMSPINLAVNGRNCYQGTNEPRAKISQLPTE